MAKTKHRVTDDSHDKAYFTIVPALVKALSRSPYDYILWETVKEIAGEKGECYITTDDLAILSMMSTGQVSKCRAYWLEIGLLKGELRKDPGYPQPVWHLRIPDIWKENIAWGKEHESIQARIQYKLEQKRSLHQVKASPGEEGPSPGEEGPSPGEGNNIQKENPEGDPTMKHADPLSFDLERATSERNWATPLEAGGDDAWQDGPVDAFAALVGLSTLYLPDKKRQSWALALKQLATSWSTEDHIITPQDVEEAIKALPDSEFGWKTFASPYEEGFQNCLAILMGKEPPLPLEAYGIKVRYE